jgi:ribulose 1,5-bisphosphate carboxylase large subunit-like protein
MRPLSPAVLDSLWNDIDLREEQLRAVASERLALYQPLQHDDHIVAKYFLALRTKRLSEIARDIAYHATSGIRDPESGSLLAQCTGRAVGVDEWDPTGRIGLLYMAYPLKMMLDANGALTSSDLLHCAASAIIFDVYENQDARLLELTIPDRILKTFPGPALGAMGIRERTNLSRDEPAFGTILKPTAGITPKEVGELVEECVRSPMISFIKEDENLYPRLDYSPVAERTRQAVAAIERATEQREGRGVIFAPHVTSAPHQLLETVFAVLEAGATGIMFSESFTGGTVRMVREATKTFANPPAIYGHNGGIGVRTRCIWRELIDFLARLDGIDFRQTAPVRIGPPFIRPYRQEWEASEAMLTKPLPGIKPVMIARAGGLDQGNIIPNLQHAADRGTTPFLLMLAGSAINSIKNGSGRPDPQVGVEAMYQAVELFRAGELRDVPLEGHVTSLYALARSKRYKSLLSALAQRYPEVCN